MLSFSVEEIVRGEPVAGGFAMFTPSKVIANGAGWSKACDRGWMRKS
jgi:hypothetical protein